MGESTQVRVNRNTMAALVGVSLPTLSKYIDQGMPVATEGRRGVAWELDVADCFAWVLSRREEQWRQEHGLSADEPIDLALERARLARVQTEAGELKNAVMRRELVPARAVLEHWAQQTVATRTHLRAIPSQLKGAIPHMTADEVVLARKLIDRALSELADGLPEHTADSLEDDEGEVEATA